MRVFLKKLFDFAGEFYKNWRICLAKSPVVPSLIVKFAPEN